MPYDPSKKMIQLDPITIRQLKHLKADHDFRSYDVAIQWLLNNVQPSGKTEGG